MHGLHIPLRRVKIREYPDGRRSIRPHDDDIFEALFQRAEESSEDVGDYSRQEGNLRFGTRVGRISCLPDVVFPDEALPAGVSEVLSFLTETGQYKEGMWKTGWEKLDPTKNDITCQAQAFGQTIDAITAAVAELERRNSAAPSNRPSDSNLPDLFNMVNIIDTEATESSSNCPPSMETTPINKFVASPRVKAPDGIEERRPSHVIVDNSIDIETEPKFWWEIIVPLEFGPAADDVYAKDFSVWNSELWKHFFVMFNQPVCRRFILGIRIMGFDMIVMYVDRSGFLSSSAININRKPEIFIRVLMGLVFADYTYNGIDCFAGQDYELNETRHIVEECIAVEAETMVGRGTICFKVRNAGDKSAVSEPITQQEDMIMKDLWVDSKEGTVELDLMRELKALKLSNISYLVGGGIMTRIGEKESTRRIREKIKSLAKGLSGDEKPYTFKKDEDKAKDDVLKDAFSLPFLFRDHLRLFIQPVGRAFTEFICLEELVLGIKDIVRAIEQLEEHGFLHRDVSLNNIILVDSEKERTVSSPNSSNSLLLDEGSTSANKSVPRRKGFLIDFDLAIRAKRANKNQLRARIISKPFASIDVLTGFNYYSFHHSYWNDLESLFYVLCYICTRFSGPCGNKRGLEEFRDTLFFTWTRMSYSDEAESKKTITKKRESLEVLLKDFHKYFEPLVPMIRSLRDCIFPFGSSSLSMYQADELLRKHDWKSPEASAIQLREARRAQPFSHRKPKEVFQDIYDVIDEAVESLPAQHRLQSCSLSEESSSSTASQETGPELVGDRDNLKRKDREVDGDEGAKEESNANKKARI